MGSSAGLGYKVTAGIVIFVFTFIFSYLPFLIKSFKTNKNLVSLANCLAGGVFLSAGLIHILPDALEAWEKANKSNDGKEEEGFPYVTLSVLISFTLILFVDRVLLPGHHAHNHEEDEEQQTNPHPENTDRDDNMINDQLSQQQPGHKHAHSHSLGPYMLVVAMGFHAFFEGLALGLLDNLGGFFGFLLAILFHKWAEGAAVGISFLKNKVSKSGTIVGLVVFSSLTPLGVATGILFSKTDDKVKALLLALSAGTFLYIAISEILSEEFANSKLIVKKFIAYLLGTGLMIGVWFVEQLGSPDND